MQVAPAQAGAAVARLRLLPLLRRGLLRQAAGHADGQVAAAAAAGGASAPQARSATQSRMSLSCIPCCCHMLAG